MGNEDILENYKGTVKPSIAYYLDNNVSFIKDAQSVEKINVTINRLLKSRESSTPPAISIYLKNDSAFGAQTDEFNQILVNKGLLRKVNNDDELAAVLAHELGHILLKHNQDKSVYTALPFYLENAGTLAEVASKITQFQKQTDIETETDALNIILDDIAAPSWNREHEREADEFGLDLMIKAGYNPDAFFSMLKNLQEAQARQSERMKQMAEKAKLKAEEKTGLTSNNATTQVAVFDDVVGIFINKTIATVSEYLTKKNVDYDTLEERTNSLKKHLNEDNPNLSPRENFENTLVDFFKTASWYKKRPETKAVCNLAFLKSNENITIKSHLKTIDTCLKDRQINSNKSKKFSKKKTNLSNKYVIDKVLEKVSSKLTESDYYPANIYVSVAEAYLEHESPASAKESLEMGAKRIGRKYRFLPTMIKTAKAMNDEQNATNLLQECVDDKNRIMAILEKMVNKNEQSVLYQQCAKAKGLVSNEDQNKGQTQNNWLNPIKDYFNKN